MRFWIKIVVAFSVIVILGFGAWAFFFREKDEVVAYNRVSELVDYKESLNLFEQIEELSKFNYIIVDSEKVVIDDSSDNKKEILSIRETTMSKDLITYYDAGGNQTCTYDSYIVIEKMADDMIKYLMPYLKYTNSSDAEINSLKSCIDDYISDLQQLITSIDLVNNCQTSIKGSEIEFEVLLGNYKGFYNKYRKTLNDSAVLINLMMDVIKANAGNLKCDTNFALIDGFARSLQVSSGVNDKVEPMYAYDLHYVVVKYNAHIIGDNIYNGEYSEYDFLTSYNILLNQYNEVLDKVFNKHNLEKKKIADGENLSDIKQEAQEATITVLSVLGF